MRNLVMMKSAVAWVCVLLATASASVVSASDAILINFTSPHCGPCRAMRPVLTELERLGVPVRHVDVTEESSLAHRYGVRKTPTYVVVAGGKEITRLVGVQSTQQLTKALNTSPAGPIIQTGSQARTAMSAIGAPLTRLAPLHHSDAQFAFESRSENAQPASHDQTLASATGRRLQKQDSWSDPVRSPISPSSEAMPSLSLASAIQRAQAATVRLKVHDGRGYGAGTGTIIDVHGDEALVLTCGHLFRENEGQGKIEVDLFLGGQTRTVPGRVLDYDAEDRDIALVTIRPGFKVQPIPVVRAGQKPKSGQSVFSFGCDRGDDPSRRDTRITGVDKYNQHLGVSNLEIGGAPIDGRSGGGLFDDQGRLIGVCNAADYKNDVGIYAGPGNIHWQLDRVNLAALYQAPGRDDTLGQDDTILLASAAADHSNASTGVVGNDIANRQVGGLVQANNQEVIVIVRDRNNPGNSSQVMTLRQPTAELMSMIQRQSRR